MALEYFSNTSGINLYNSPMVTDGQLIFAKNVTGFPYGALSKRPGYGTFLGTTGSSQVNSLFSYSPYPTGSGTQLWLYAAAGSLLYYSQQGTGGWSIAQGSSGGDSGGTITNGNHVGYCVVNNVLLIGDGAGSTRHTTVGTTFTNTSLAPVAQFLAQFHLRAYTTSGTDGMVQYSDSNDATNWNTGGTSDSSSLAVPNEGATKALFVAGDRLNIAKERGDMFNYDDTTLVDMSTKYGPSSPWSIANIDDTWFYLNQYGIFSYDGANKQLISNPIQRYFYNRANTGIGTAALGSAPAAAHIWDYLVAVGTITDDFTSRPINNAILKYDFQKNQFLTWSFNNPPTAMHSFVDINNQRQLIFGDVNGNIFKLDPTKTSDNGVPIETDMVFLFTYSAQSEAFSPTSATTLLSTSYEKKWNWIRLFFNPGDEVNIQYSFTNTLTYQHLKWSKAISTTNRTGDYYQISDGVCEIRFPLDPNNLPRSRFMFLRIYDNSDNSAYIFYGVQIDADVQIIR